MYRPSICLGLLLSLGATSLGAQTRVARPRTSPGATITSPTTSTPGQTIIGGQLVSLAGPSELSASGTTQSITLTWSAAAGATGYRVWREPLGGVVALLTPSPIAATSFQDNGGPFGAYEPYTYRVTAVHAGGESAAAQATFSPPPPPPPPVSISRAEEGQTDATWCTWSYSVQWAPVGGATEYILMITQKGNFLRLINWVQTTQYEERAHPEIRLPATQLSYAATTVKAYPTHTYDYSLVAVFQPGGFRSLPSPVSTFHPPSPEASQCSSKTR